MHFAAFKGNSKAVSFIYKRAQGDNKKLLTQDKYLETPLHLASRMGHKQCITNMIFICKTESANFSFKNVDGATALDVARENGHYECVEVLNMIHN